MLTAGVHAGRSHVTRSTLACTGNKGLTLAQKVWVLHTSDPVTSGPGCHFLQPDSTFSIHTENTNPSGFIHLIWLLAQGWFLFTGPCDFLNIRWITFLSINKVGTRACLSLWVLVHSPDKCSLVPSIGSHGSQDLCLSTAMTGENSWQSTCSLALG